MTLFNRHNLISLGLHLMFLMSCIWWTSFHHVSLPSLNSSMLLAYPVQYKTDSSEKKAEHKKVLTGFLPVNRVIARQDRRQSVQKKQVISQSAARSVSDQLSAILHQRIQAEQVYPFIAQEMHQEGVVTVMFVLTPKGQVEQLEIKQPSAFSQLNQAALLAVKQAAPFVEAEQFIQEKQRFQVDIEFKLG